MERISAFRPGAQRAFCGVFSDPGPYCVWENGPKGAERRQPVPGMNHTGAGKNGTCGVFSDPGPYCAWENGPKGAERRQPVPGINHTGAGKNGTKSQHVERIV